MDRIYRMNSRIYKILKTQGSILSILNNPVNPVHLLLR